VIEVDAWHERSDQRSEIREQPLVYRSVLRNARGSGEGGDNVFSIDREISQRWPCERNALRICQYIEIVAGRASPLSSSTGGVMPRNLLRTVFYGGKRN
jgi:hypothetical protein